MDIDPKELTRIAQQLDKAIEAVDLIYIDSNVAQSRKTMLKEDLTEIKEELLSYEQGDTSDKEDMSIQVDEKIKEMTEGLDKKDAAKYQRSNYRQFIGDMITANLGDQLSHYSGRFYYTGPAVEVESIYEAIIATKVKCRTDNMGLQYVVYPE